MLHEYRKKTTIKAEQFDGSVDMMRQYDIKANSEGVYFAYIISTKEGNMTINRGDWIATGIDGEHWVIADDIFRRTYERCD